MSLLVSLFTVKQVVMCKIISVQVPVLVALLGITYLQNYRQIRKYFINFKCMPCYVICFCAKISSNILACNA